MKANKENLKSIFSKMEKDGFDTKNELKWGYYFFDKNKKNLETVFDELKDHNYNFENIIEMEDKNWRLFVSKVEVLGYEKLHKRNIAFNELAEYCNVDLYDGWDVEKL